MRQHYSVKNPTRDKGRFGGWSVRRAEPLCSSSSRPSHPCTGQTKPPQRSSAQGTQRRIIAFDTILRVRGRPVDESKKDAPRRRLVPRSAKAWWNRRLNTARPRPEKSHPQQSATEANTRAHAAPWSSAFSTISNIVFKGKCNQTTVLNIFTQMVYFLSAWNLFSVVFNFYLWTLYLAPNGFRRQGEA